MKHPLAKGFFSKMGLRKLLGKRKSEAPSSQQAIDKLKDMEEILVKKQLYFEEKINAELVLAKKHGKTNQRQALAALKRKKIHEMNLAKLDGVLMKLEAQITALENADHNTEVMKVLEQTNKALKKANKDLDIDKVAELMDEITDGLDMSDMLSSAISRPIGDVPDEEDLMNELMELEKEQDDKVPISLPSVPAGPITRSKSREMERHDSEMADLEQWAAAN